ncbi:MAG: polyprenyl synthetase family protein [Desulfurococcales archaeon]|nr:polyprenyl synthetase family protein [Desulfurococcales archaeon]
MLKAEEALHVEARLYEEWLEARDLIESRIAETIERLGSDGLPEVARYISEGGKRFRGFLVILTAKAYGARPEDAVDAAVAIELVQAASLAIDDIVDVDKIRRNRKASWLVHGIGKTVLSSLLLIPVAQRMVEKLGVRALYHVIRAWEATVRGEILDVFLVDELKPEDYLELVRLKTGSLFKLSLILGYLSSERKTDNKIRLLEAYGDKLGILYQIADDLADYARYVRGEKEKLDPGEKLYLKWALQQDENPIRAGLQYLAHQTRETAAITEKLGLHEEYTLIYKYIPVFMTRKMLEEGGLHNQYEELLKTKQ